MAARTHCATALAGLAAVLACAGALAADPRPAVAQAATPATPATAKPPATPLAPSQATAPPAAASAAARALPAFATVGDTVISGQDYQRALAVAIRKKYYHAKPPEAELAAFQREVGDQVVNRVLLLAEARRRGLQPDRDKIAATVAGYDAQYKGSANWSANREKMLASVVPQLERDSVYERLEQLVRQVPEPSEALARGYYEQHREQFVEPEQVKLSVILLKVDPSAGQPAWTSALAEAQNLHKKLKAGADFAALARLHSGDRSAPQGGLMDYTHRGMLPAALHDVVDKLQPRQLAEPVQLLEGIAILRLEDRRAARPRSFEQVRDRAADLWQRAEGQARWERLIAELRRSTVIRIDESHYAPQRGDSEKPRAG